MVKVYIASPYSIGDQGENVRISMSCANDLMNEGFAPYSPLLSHFQHITFPRPYDDWMSLDIEWLSVCDCLIRLPGESTGADMEVEFARANNIPVFYNIEQLLEYFNTQYEDEE